jgi:N utilization substance protein B
MPDKMTELFPLSQFKQIKGTRRLAREKAFQVLAAHEVSEVPWTAIFSHVFFREFNLGEDEEKTGKLLTPEEIVEIEADIPINWDELEIIYARDLIENSVLLRKEIDDWVTGVVDNWEMERIALIDRLLMRIAVTELLKFKDIPSKVSINEAIELAKKYSTEKSSVFINGILDRVLIKLEKEGLLKK